MSLVDDIINDRNKLKIPRRRAVGKTAYKEETAKEVMRMHLAGERRIDIAKKFGFSPQRITRFVNDEKKRIKKSGLTLTNYFN